MKKSTIESLNIAEPTSEPFHGERLGHLLGWASLGKLTAHVSHDLNNPIGIIHAKTHMLLRRPDLSEDRLRQDLQIILEQCERLRQLSLELSCFGDWQDNDFTRLSLEEPVQKAIQYIRSKANRKGVVVEFKELRLLPEILGQSKPLEQMLMQLFFNAIDAMSPGGGQLTISITEALVQNDLFLDMTIKDTGRGMDEKTVLRSCEPFYSTKQQSGLGLTFVEQVVKSHMATMLIRSNFGEGTQIHLRFPAFSNMN